MELMHFWLYANFFHYFRNLKTAEMKKWIIFSLLLILINCKGKKKWIILYNRKSIRYIQRNWANMQAATAESFGEKPLRANMFVERVTRRITSNLPDNEGLPEIQRRVYTGLYPKELILSNAPVNSRNTVCHDSASWGRRNVQDKDQGNSQSFPSVSGKWRSCSSPLMKIIWMKKRPGSGSKPGMEALRKAINNVPTEDRQQSSPIRDALTFDEPIGNLS